MKNYLAGLDPRWPLHEQMDVARQLVGKLELRRKHEEIYRSIPCTHCGALIGESCVADSGVIAPAGHQARRHGTHEAQYAYVSSVAVPVLEARTANQRATELQNAPTHAWPQPVKLARPVIRPKRPIDLSDLEVDRAPKLTLAEALGASAKRLTVSRLAEATAWDTAMELSARLGEAEAEYAELERRVRSATSPEDLLAEVSS